MRKCPGVSAKPPLSQSEGVSVNILFRQAPTRPLSLLYITRYHSSVAGTFVSPLSVNFGIARWSTECIVTLRLMFDDDNSPH